MNSIFPSDSESEKSGVGFLRSASEAVETEELDELLALYECHAAKAQAALLNAFKADPAPMAVRYPHLRKAHLPPLTPDPHLNPAFTTTEAALAQAAQPRPPVDRFRTPTPMPVFSPNHPEHVPLTPAEELRPYVRDSAESGLIGLPPALAEYFGVADAARAAELRLRRQEARTSVYPRDAVISHPGPQPWKPATSRS